MQQVQEQPQVVESGTIEAILMADHQWHAVDPATLTFTRTELGNIVEFIEPSVGAIVTHREHILAFRFSH